MGIRKGCPSAGRVPNMSHGEKLLMSGGACQGINSDRMMESLVAVMVWSAACLEAVELRTKQLVAWLGCH